MRAPILAFALILAIPAAPSLAQTATVLIVNEMPVVSSDGVVVAKVNHVPGNERAYGPNEMFFTADRFYNLRRIYGREVTVSGGKVQLKMTAAQFRARKQNPE